MPIIFYLGAIFWTLGYDTIYGYQDIKDDEIIGLKSTSIKFRDNPKKFLFTCYILSITFFILAGQYMNFDYKYLLLLIIPAIHLFFFQIKLLDFKNPKNCLKTFKSNNFFGLIIFFNILICKII